MLGSPVAGVGDSLAAVASYDALMPFSQAQVLAAMASNATVPMPTLASLGANQVAALRSPSRKMNRTQSDARTEALQAFFTQTYPGIALADFHAWAQPMYQTFVRNLGLQNAPRLSQAHFLRTVLLGMTAVNVIINGGVINHFAVLDPVETVYFTGLAANATTIARTPKGRALVQEEVQRLLDVLPSSYDMRNNGNMPPVRDQQQCGSCWAFTTSSSLEIQNIYHNHNADVGELSEQMLVSCNVDGPNANQGCRGGVIQYAYDFIHAQGGLPLRSTYPYTDYFRSSVATPECDAALTSPKVLQCDGRTVYLPSTDATSSAAEVHAAEVAIMQMVASGYPVTIQIAGSSRCFQSYSSGLLTCACGKEPAKDPIDHAILVVGYTPSYFIARNQWGSSWGEEGYVNLPRNSANPGLDLPAWGQCNMLVGPLVAGDVQQLMGTSSSPTASPAVASRTPSVQHVGETCPTSKVQCSHGGAKACCKRLCARGQCTTDVCCPNGACAVIKKHKTRAALVLCGGGQSGVLKRLGG